MRSKDSLIIIFIGRCVRVSATYLLDFRDLASEGAVGDVNDGADSHRVGQGLVGAGDALVVSFDGVVGDNLQSLALSLIHI